MTFLSQVGFSNEFWPCIRPVRLLPASERLPRAPANKDFQYLLGIFVEGKDANLLDYCLGHLPRVFCVQLWILIREQYRYAGITDAVHAFTLQDELLTDALKGAGKGK